MIEQGERKNIISVITNPLGFFALSLLIVEGFLGIVLIFSKSLANPYFWGMIIGAVLFLLVVTGVWLLVWFKPRNLTFGERGYIEKDKMMIWGSNDAPEIKKVLESEPSSKADIGT